MSTVSDLTDPNGTLGVSRQKVMTTRERFVAAAQALETRARIAAAQRVDKVKEAQDTLAPTVATASALLDTLRKLAAEWSEPLSRVEDLLRRTDIRATLTAIQLQRLEVELRVVRSIDNIIRQVQDVPARVKALTEESLKGREVADIELTVSGVESTPSNITESIERAVALLEDIAGSEIAPTGTPPRERETSPKRPS